MLHLFPYKWNLTDGYPAKGIKKTDYNVFGTFICGGGSTMGYKLAGFNHLGGVEIDKKVADVYNTNHKPKYLYIEDLRRFNKRNDLPKELYNLDLLDGSPPCSTFSMAGSREKAWGKEKQFREGQKMQTLDDLVFVYCETILKLLPKVFLLENVKGIIQGNAKLYSKQIVKILSEKYNVQVFCLNAASMGVPQKRERVFFIGHKKEFCLPKLKLGFNEVAIPFKQVASNTTKTDTFIEHSEKYTQYWKKAKKGSTVGLFHASCKRLDENDVCYTIGAQGGYNHFHHSKCRQLSNNEVCMVGTYPLDYNFTDLTWHYLIGMSVPPVMTAQISNQIREQWLDKIQLTNN